MNRSNPAIDELLVLNAQRGDARAMSQLARRWTPHLLTICTNRLKSPQQANDAVQDTWMTVIRQLNQLQDPSRFPGWITRIAIHQCINQIRAVQKQRRHLHEFQQSASHYESLKEESNDIDSGKLRDALQQLSFRHRQLVTLHYLQELSVEQIARQLTIPAGTVKSGLYHARERLRTLLCQEKGIAQ